MASAARDGAGDTSAIQRAIHNIKDGLLLVQFVLGEIIQHAPSHVCEMEVKSATPFFKTEVPETEINSPSMNSWPPFSEPYITLRMGCSWFNLSLGRLYSMQRQLGMMQLLNGGCVSSPILGLRVQSESLLGECN
jgi:hypothetical protein